MTALIATLILAAQPWPSAFDALTVHPHYPRKVEMRLGFRPEADVISVSHLTVTFNRDGFAKAKPGFSWHLANGRLETTRDIVVGGVKIKKGAHSIKARKKKDGSWELVVDAPGRFQSKLTDSARPLATEFFEAKSPKEHMTLDIHPHGDKGNTKLWLEVHMDKYVARALVDVSE